MRALITGADGFVGRHLIRHLVSSGDVVQALTGHHFADSSIEGVDAVPLDIRNAPRLREIVADFAPDVVYHLAAVSGAGDRELVDAAIDVNVIGSLNVLRACASSRPGVRLLFISSGMVYGNVVDGRPLDETSPVRPINLYGASKAAAEEACRQLAPHLGVEFIVARPFNHTGPGQTHDYAIPSFAAKISALRRGETDVIETGRLDTVRDLCDVRDVARAYRLLGTRGNGTYNVASGCGIAMSDALSQMMELAGVAGAKVIAPMPSVDSEPSVLIGDAQRLGHELGWQPQITLTTTLADVLLENGALS